MPRSAAPEVATESPVFNRETDLTHDMDWEPAALNVPQGDLSMVDSDDPDAWMGEDDDDNARPILSWKNWLKRRERGYRSDKFDMVLDPNPKVVAELQALERRTGKRQVYPQTVRVQASKWLKYCYDGLLPRGFFEPPEGHFGRKPNRTTANDPLGHLRLDEIMRSPLFLQAWAARMGEVAAPVGGEPIGRSAPEFDPQLLEEFQAFLASRNSGAGGDD